MVKISVIAHPNVKNPRIEEDLLGTLHVFINAPALEGKANRAVIESLARHFGVNKSNGSLIQGNKSKIKVFEITG